MAKVVAIGKQSFESIREKDNFYVDKTLFIREWWDSDDSVTLMSIKIEGIYLKDLIYGKMKNIVNYREHIR